MDDALPADSVAACGPRLGFVVNPIAGLGGRVGLRGTDGATALREAINRGATPIAPARADRALARLTGVSGVRILAAPGAMGADLAVARQFATEVVGSGVRREEACGAERGSTVAAHSGATSPHHTRAAARAMLDQRVDLLLFAGGDGTARDIVDIVGTQIPLLGIPTGVKMHSGVFAATPEAAGEVAATFLGTPDARSVYEADIADIDEDALQDGRVSTRLFGCACVPAQRSRVVGPKRGGPGDERALDALAEQLASELKPERLYLIGPGTTTSRVLSHLGLDGTLLGVDAIRDGRLVAKDARESQLLGLLDGTPAGIIAGVVGGQGFLFGRGNQQISAEVIRRVGTDSIIVLADASKLRSLSPPWLRVDTGDPGVDEMLLGYRIVRTGPGSSTVMKVSN